MSAAPPPSDVILTSLKEILDAIQDGRNKHAVVGVVEKCLSLLKRKKTINDLGLTRPLQRTLLQTWLQQEQYDKVLEWVRTTDQEGQDSATNNKNQSSLFLPSTIHQDLILYARYRKQEYETVLKLASSPADSNSSRNDDGDDDDDDGAVSALALQHLVAQSHFHLNHADSALRVYHDFLAETSADQYDAESHMEILTNALAVIGSSGTVPQVTFHDGSDRLGYTFWMDHAGDLLQDQGEEISTDLALNLGTVQFLSDPSSIDTTTSNWLERAMDTTDSIVQGGDKDGDDHIQIQTNLQWSKHFWYRDVEDVLYPTSKGTAAAHTGASSSYHTLPVSQSIAILNQALLEDDLLKIPLQPHPKWNSLQVVMYWYSRAVLQFKAQQLVECQESCQSLKKAVSKLSGGTSGAVGTGSGKKKKNKVGAGSSMAPSTASTSSSSIGSPLHLWWECRVDVLLAHVLHSQSKTKDAITKLDATLESLRGVSPSSLVLDHAIAHVQLHRYVLLDQSSPTTSAPKRSQQLRALLMSLPKTIQSKPAVQLTLEELRSTGGGAPNDDARAGGNGPNKKTTPKTPVEEADALFALGQYNSACEWYEKAGPSKGSGNDVEVGWTVDAQLRYVQALAMTGQHAASQALFESMDVTMKDWGVGSSLPDANALETKALPRRTNTASSGSNVKSAIAKNLDANITNGQNDDRANRPSTRDKVLRQRARKREAHLKELEAKGQYNPDRPSVPNPERWIPKHERSRSRGGGKGSRGNHQGTNRSAQGGGSQADALRLDAAARRAGTAPSPTGPSTANLKVSSGGRKGGRRR
jgi:hypothetical protein